MKLNLYKLKIEFAGKEKNAFFFTRLEFIDWSATNQMDKKQINKRKTTEDY